MAARLLLLIPWLGLAAATNACVQDDGSRFNPLASAMGAQMSVEDERTLGYEFDREARKQLELIEDPLVVGFLADLGQRMVATIEPQPFVYRFRVIRDRRLNAFAVPGGYIYMHSGTILSASRLDELAGVLGHEIAHVKERHYARMREQNAVPQLLTQLAGIGASVATGSAAPIVVAAGLNVALELRYSRQFENEADHFGAIFVTRAGYDPRGLVRFFELIVAESERPAVELPPYLYTHPDVKARMAAVSAAAETLRPVASPDPALERAFHDAQARLALLVATERSVWLRPAAQPDRARSDRWLARAEALAAEGNRDGAIAALAEAEALEPADPRLSFRRGELLEEAGRRQDAIAAYRRTVVLDPTTALVLYKLGAAYGDAGDRHRATYYLEQAVLRSKPGTALRQRSEAALELITFPVVTEAGLSGELRDGLPGEPRSEFGPGDAQVVWWGQIGPRFLGRRGEIVVRWSDPSARLHAEGPARSGRRPYAAARLELRGGAEELEGVWTVEARLGEHVVDRRSFRLQPAR